MAINSIAYNEKLTGELDKALVQKAVTGFLADNALRSKFIGAKTVLIPEVGLNALADYDRDNGFTQGSIAVTNTPFTLQMDRGRSFVLDAQDSDESGIANLMGNVSTEFVRTKVVPEMDAYVLSKLGGLAVTESQTVTYGTDAIKVLQDAIMKAQDASGFGEELVAFVDATFLAALMNSASITRYLATSDFKKGEMNTQVKTFNGVPILPVSSDRMKTAYTFYDGVTGGQEEGGFVPADTAKSIRLLVMPKSGASLVKKTEKTRIFTPDQNINADAYRLNYRVYYDLFIKNSRKNTIWASVE